MYSSIHDSSLWAVLAKVSTAVIKNTMTNVSLGMKELFHPKACSVIHHLRRPEQESGGTELLQRPWMSALCLLPMTWLGQFLIAPWTTSPEMALPTLSWTLACQSSIKNMHHRLAHRGIFLIEVPLPEWLYVVSSWQTLASTWAFTEYPWEN